MTRQAQRPATIWKRSSLIGAASISFLVMMGCGDDGDGNSGGSVTFTGGPVNLTFAAAQDGDGPWTVLERSVNRDYSFPVTAPTYGIVAVCGDDAFAVITVMQATVAETTSPSFECNAALDTLADVNASVAGVPNGENVSLHVANQEHYGPPVTRTIAMLPTGQWDIFALRRQGTATPIIADRIIRRNDVMLSAGPPLPLAFDFAAEGFATESHTVSVQGVQSGETSDVKTRLRTKPGGTLLELGPFTDGTYLALPASQLRGDDIHAITASAYAADGLAYRQVRRWFVASEDFTAMLPALPSPPIVDVEAPTPYLRVRSSVPSGVAVDRYDLIYDQYRSTTSYMRWNAYLTGGYVSSVNATAYTLPDLATLAGFAPSWGLMPGVEILWQVIMSSSDGPVADLVEASPSAARLDGREFEITQRSGRFRP